MERFRRWLGLDAQYPRDKAPRLLWRVIVFGALFFVLVVYRILRAFPGFVDSVYSDHLGAWITVVLGRITSVLPFSLAEVCFWCIIAYLVVMPARALFFVVLGKRRVRNAASNGVVRVFTLASVLLLLFYTNWAISFARPPLIHRMQWDAFAPATQTADADELCRLSEELVLKTNEYYKEIFKTDDLGHASAAPDSMGAIDRAIEDGYRAATVKLHLPSTFSVTRGPAKAIRGSFVLSNMLTLGFYSPWTGEANYNRDITPCALPEVMAHEKAHQHCVTSEDEANFFGFIACAYSDNAYARYSAYLFAHRQLLFELVPLDKARAEKIIKMRLPGVQKDVDAINQFSNAHRGRISNASRKVNDTYLKANRVPGGVKSYQLSARLLLAFSHVNDGSCVVKMD